MKAIIDNHSGVNRLVICFTTTDQEMTFVCITTIVANRPAFQKCASGGEQLVDLFIKTFLIVLNSNDVICSFLPYFSGNLFLTFLGVYGGRWFSKNKSTNSSGMTVISLFLCTMCTCPMQRRFFWLSNEIQDLLQFEAYKREIVKYKPEFKTGSQNDGL